jgi:large subunit ribosomal protein L5
MAVATVPVPRLKKLYDDTLRAQLKDTLQLRNVMEVPRLEKIVVNMGVGDAVAQASLLEHAVTDLCLITGQ